MNDRKTGAVAALEYAERIALSARGGRPARQMREARTAVEQLIAKADRLLEHTQIVELRREGPGVIAEFRAALAKVKS